jgi:hypothetical protein
MNQDSEWSQMGSLFALVERADKVQHLPGGIYRFEMDPNGNWFLKRTSDKFEFTFKVYSSHDDVINRIVKNWKSNGGNLGVLMNGLRGAGKTMAAQLLANRVIEEANTPVLIVRGPIPLQLIFDAVKQPMMVIFDEFEKTHDKEHQQKLLSVIDGTSRSKYDRLVVFTTNTNTIDENFKDRPSRIRYVFEFNKVADQIIDGLIADILPKNLQHLRGDIIQYLATRSICTIDIVKAVINEVKTFKETPMEFDAFLNVSKGIPPAYTIHILHPENDAILQTVTHYFKPESRGALLFAGSKRAIDEFLEPVQVCSSSFGKTFYINLLKKCPEEGCWLANVNIPTGNTFYKDFSHLSDTVSLWIDKQPEDWEFPFTNDSVKADPKVKKALDKVWDKSMANGTLYGTGERAVLKIKIEPNRDAASSFDWKPTVP